MSVAARTASRSPLRVALVRIGAVLAALLLLALLTHPWWLASLVGRYLSATSGRAVHVDSIRVGLSAALEPVVHMTGVEIENVAWADSKAPFARVREAVAVVSWRSVTERRPVLALLVLREGEVDLERQADGLRNWRLRDPENRGPGRYKVLSLRAERSRLRVLHRGIELDVRIAGSAAGTQAPLSGTGEALPLRLDFEGTLRGLPFEGSAVTGPLLTFYETGRTFALRGSAAAAGLRLEAEGHAGDIFRAPEIDVRAVLAGKPLAPWRPFLGARNADARTLRLEGRVVAGDRRYALLDSRAKIGASDLAGEVRWDHGSERRSLHAALTSASADLADLFWLAGRDAHGAIAGAAPAAQRAATAFDLDALRGLDAEVTFDAQRLRSARFPALQALALKAALADGALAISDLDLGYADGHATGRIAFDASVQPPTAEAELDLRGFRIEALLPPAAAKRLTGALQGRVRLKGSGDSRAALIASAAGTASATLAGGTVSSLLDAELGLEGGKIVRSLISGDEALALPCAALVLDVRGGTGTIRSLIVDSANTLTTGTGTIDLRDASVDIVLTPTPKRAGLFELDRSIRLRGPLAHPTHALVERAPAGPAAPCSGP